MTVGRKTDRISLYRGRGCVVLGASGFIGRWVVDALVAAGAEVTAVVRDRAGFETESGADSVAVAEADVAEPAVLRRLLEDARPAVTFNLIGYGVRSGQDDRAEAVRLNAAFPPLLAELLAGSCQASWPGSALVHAGSQAEYGRVELVHEAVEPNPVTPYGRTKLAGSAALMARSRALGLPAVSARIFNVYGPGEPAHRLLPTLIRRAADDGPIDLTSGEQERDFAFVGDVAEGLLRLGAAVPLRGDPVNLATGRPIPVKKLVLEAAQQLHIPPARLRFGALPERPSEIRSQSVSVSRLVELTGWSPPTSLMEGIRWTVAASARLSR